MATSLKQTIATYEQAKADLEKVFADVAEMGTEKNKYLLMHINESISLCNDFANTLQNIYDDRN